MMCHACLKLMQMSNPGNMVSTNCGTPPKVLGLLTPTAIGPEGKTVDALAQRMRSESISRQRPQWLQACGSKAGFPIFPNSHTPKLKGIHCLTDSSRT